MKMLFQLQSFLQRAEFSKETSRHREQINSHCSPWQPSPLSLPLSPSENENKRGNFTNLQAPVARTKRNEKKSRDQRNKKRLETHLINFFLPLFPRKKNACVPADRCAFRHSTVLQRFHYRNNFPIAGARFSNAFILVKSGNGGVFVFTPRSRFD